MSIFDLYSVDEIDSLIGKVMTGEKTAHTYKIDTKSKEGSNIQ